MAEVDRSDRTRSPSGQRLLLTLAELPRATFETATLALAMPLLGFAPRAPGRLQACSGGLRACGPAAAIHAAV